LCGEAVSGAHGGRSSSTRLHVRQLFARHRVRSLLRNYPKRCADKQPGRETLRRNIPAAAAVDSLDGVGASPGYHIRTVASSDHLPRGEKPAPSPIFYLQLLKRGADDPEGELKCGSTTMRA
jgi:hypothetical protein